MDLPTTFSYENQLITIISPHDKQEQPETFIEKKEKEKIQSTTLKSLNSISISNSTKNTSKNTSKNRIINNEFFKGVGLIKTSSVSMYKLVYRLVQFILSNEGIPGKGNNFH